MNKQKITNTLFLLLITGFFLTAIVLGGLVLRAVDKRNAVWLSTSAFILSDESRGKLNGINTDIDVRVGFDEVTFRAAEPRIAALLDRFRAVTNTKIELFYQDTDRLLDAEQEESVLPDTLLLQTSTRRIHLPLTALHDADAGNNILAHSAEEVLLDAFVRLCDPSPPVAGFLGLGDGAELNTFSALLEQQGWQVMGLTIPQLNGTHCQLVVVDFPQADFSEAELAELKTFLGNDGTLFVLADDHTAQTAPQFCAFLRQYGIAPQPARVADVRVDPEEDEPYLLLTEPDVGALRFSRFAAQWEEGACLIAVDVPPIATIQPSASADVMVLFGSQAGGTIAVSPQKDGDYPAAPSENGSDGASLPLAVFSKAEHGSVLCFGAAFVSDNGGLATSLSAYNRPYLAALFRDLSPNPEVISHIEPHHLLQHTLPDLSMGQKAAIAVLFCLIVPGVLVFAGLLATSRRRSFTGKETAP